MKPRRISNAILRRIVKRKQQTLKRLYQDHNEALIREKKDVEALQKQLGVIDPAAAAQQHALLEQRLTTVANSISRTPLN